MTKLKRLYFALGGAAVLCCALSACFLSYYATLAPQMLTRHRPEFVQSVTYPAILACALCVASGTTHYVVRGNRTRAALVSAWGPFAILPLPVDVFLFDSSEFNLHFASFQNHLGILPWFTNADLLLSLSLLIAGSSALLFVRGRLRWGTIRN